jgi:prepilin-type N-terminal cleavage/methylation domain-containing protein
MKRFRNALLQQQGGFTLVEMAIVLIIIGIILGAVLKGQDLITNARAKRLTTTLNSWNAMSFAFMDRMGRFPGDGRMNGIMGDQTAGGVNEQTGVNTTIGELTNAASVNAMTGAPQNPIQIGGQTFWVYFGNIQAGAPLAPRNAMVVCASVNCTTALSNDALQIMQATDTSIDGRAGAGVDQFRAITAATIANIATLPAANGGRANGTLTVATIPGGVLPGGTAATPWAAGQVGAVWLFDRPF